MSTPSQGFSLGAALDDLQRRYGGSFREEDGEVAVGVAAVAVVPRDFERVALVMVNLGTTSIFVRPNRNPTTVAGIRLGPNGGTIAMNLDQDALLASLDWAAISDVAGGLLYFLLVRRETKYQQTGG
jgi:hypothetical protein